MKKLLLLLVLAAGSVSGAAEKPDVLFIAVDDMNDWTTLFDENNPIKTPNLERLAARGMFFEKAYCTSPACGPSRASVMTGLDPTTSGVYGFQPWRNALPDAVTLPKYFNLNGYATRGAGKIFHHGHDPGSTDGKGGDGTPAPNNSFEEFFGMFSEAFKKTRKDKNLNGFSPKDHPKIGNIPGDWGEFDTKLLDEYTVEWVSKQMRKTWDRPLFLAAGIYSPHLPHYAPTDIFDMYPIEQLQMPPMPVQDLADVPERGVKKAHTQHFRYQLPMAQPEGSPGSFKKMIQSYQAASTFADRMVGKLLDDLDASGKADNTIIVLWSDHGYHLGDKKSVVKFTLWEKSNHVPFIVVAPGVTTPGSRCSKPVSLLDIYKTLVELADLPDKEGLDGSSLVPLLKNPNQDWNPALMSQGKGDYAVRSDRYRYIRYLDGTEELYDHDTDPWEHINLAKNPEYQAIIKKHRKWLPKNEAPASPFD